MKTELGRRDVMRGGVAALACLAPAAAGAAGSNSEVSTMNAHTKIAGAQPVTADAKLMKLIEQALDLGKRTLDSDLRRDRLSGEYGDKSPRRPDVLRWRPAIDTGFIGYDVAAWHWSKELWCDPSPSAINKLRTEPITMLGGQPWPKGQARADEIVAAHDAYQAQLKQLRAEIGLDAAAAERDRLEEQYDDLVAEIVAMPARTAEGILAKARLVYEACWGQEVEESDSFTIDYQIMQSMVRDLVAANA